jgi:NAD(P)-dependent dehydrogenase (short-subunit alcohol dehydrogenase family)
MIERNHGRIINISSRAGTEGHARYSAYCASKFGIIGFTQAVADEVKGSGITINVICPDEVDTPLNRRNHPDISDYSVWTTVDEIADVVVFFASAVSRAIQGATIEVYGHARR